MADRVEIEDEDNLTDDERDNLLSFDPFDDGFEGDAENEAALDTADDEAEEPIAAAEPVEEEVAPPVAVSSGPSEREKLLTEQNELLRAQMQTIAMAQKPVTADAKAQPEDNIPAYQFNVTDDYINAIRDDDPQVVRAALQGIMTGVARATHIEMQKEYKAHTQSAIAGYVNRHTEVTKIQTDVQSDYYGNFPQHNKPAIRAMVVAIGQNVMSEMGANAWSPELRNEIGKRVNETLVGGLQGGAPQGGGGPATTGSRAEQNTQSRAAAKTQRPGGPKQTRTTSRPPMDKGNSIGAEIQDLMEM